MKAKIFEVLLNPTVEQVLIWRGVVLDDGS
jgi:hypothetical protein